MDMKQWTVLILLLMSADYSRATFGFFGGGASEEEEVDFSEYGNFRGWDRCSSPLRDWLESKCDVIKSSLRSELGSRCALRARSIEEFDLKNVFAEGFHKFELAEPCHCHLEDGGSALIHFAIGFEEIVTSCLLEVSGAAGGIFGEFASFIFRILGHFTNKIIKIAFPRFQIDLVLSGQLGARGLVLKDFWIRQPEGKINFLTRALVQHASYLEGWFKQPLGFAINIFLRSKFRSIFEIGIKKWKLEKKLFGDLGSHLGGALGGQGLGTSQIGDGLGGHGGFRGHGNGRGSRHGWGRQDDSSDEGHASEIGDGQGRSIHGGKRGGWKSGKRWGHGGHGGSGYGGHGGLIYGGHGGSSYGGHGGSSYGGNGGSSYGGTSDGGYESDEELEYGKESEEGEYGKESEEGEYGEESEESFYSTEESERDESGEGGYRYNYR